MGLLGGNSGEEGGALRRLVTRGGGEAERLEHNLIVEAVGVDHERNAAISHIEVVKVREIC